MTSIVEASVAGATSDERFRWGIVGTGLIAGMFAADVALLPDAVVQAVGSRSQESAAAFGDKYSVPTRHSSYADLVADPEIDAVYVATPHPDHHASALLAIAAGKATLVEKPFTMSAAEAAELIDAARARGVFLMEAMWTRFLPHMAHIRALLESGALGDLRTVVADHGQWFAYDPAFRLFAPELGGGALLDLGIYPVSFASWVLGSPEKVTAVSNRAATGVDAQTSIVLQYAGGQHAVLTTTLEAATSTRAAISGTDARIEIEHTWYAPTTFSVVHRDGRVEAFDEPHEGRGMGYQATEVARCVREGRTESSVMSLDETLAIMRTMDEVRRQIGLVYPGER